MHGMRGAFALLTALVVLGGCTQDQDRGGFGDPLPSIAPLTPIPTEPEPEEAAQLVRVSAPGGLRYEPETLEVRAGRTTEFEFSNQDRREHTFVISELAVVMLAGAGQTVRSTVEIDTGNTGRFAYFCSIAGHRDGGMEGTIVVL
jgi:plastocyanin